MTERDDAAPAWAPAFSADPETISAAAFTELCTQKFAEWSKTAPAVSALSITSGWYTVTPQMAEDLLRRNAANRRVSLATVKKYARDMKAGTWMPTGQPGLIDKDGKVQDFQHRLWACYLSGTPFVTYIVSDVQPHPDLFCFIDSVKPRSASDTLFTSGLNGLSSVIAQAIKLAYRYDNNALSILSTPRIQDLTKPEILTFARANPELAEAAHIVNTNYTQALKIIDAKDVAVFFAWRVLALYDPATLDTFFAALGAGAHLADDDPILSLRDRLIREGELTKPHVLALLIKGFNLHIKGEKVGRKGLYLRDSEKYPRLEPDAPLASAAE